METTQILNYLITILALVASLLAWIAKLRWSKEFKEAKEAEIKAKIAQMDLIREKVEFYESIISNKLFDYSKQTIANLEQLLIKTEKSKQEEINNILSKIKESETLLKQKYGQDENVSLSNIFSREIRTPINAIIGFSHLTISDEFDKEEKQKFNEIIIENAGHILSLFQDLMQLLISLQKFDQPIEHRD